MELAQYKAIIKEAFESNGFGHLIDDAAAEKFYLLSNILVETNKITNLTAITDEIDIIYKHFLDSATVCDCIPYGSKIIDVGCGAGFPSLPIAILRQDTKITSLDSTGKKIDFVNKAAERLGLENVRGVCSRAEDFVSGCREAYDVSLGRAVSRLNVLSEICIPFVSVDGRFIAMKASKGEEEFLEAKNGIARLGCELEKESEIRITSDKEKIERKIYCFKKIKNTPKEFPRNYSQITKKPL